MMFACWRPEFYGFRIRRISVPDAAASHRSAVEASILREEMHFGFRGNQRYAEDFDPPPGRRSRPRLAIVLWADPRAVISPDPRKRARITAQRPTWRGHSCLQRRDSDLLMSPRSSDAPRNQAEPFSCLQNRSLWSRLSIGASSFRAVTKGSGFTELMITPRPQEV